MSENVHYCDCLKSEYVFGIYHFKNSVLHCLQNTTDFSTFAYCITGMRVIVTAYVELYPIGSSQTYLFLGNK